jgi:hypothetical protein
MRADDLIEPELRRFLLRGRWFAGVAGARRRETFELRDRMTEELEAVDREIACLVEERLDLTRWLARIRVVLGGSARPLRIAELDRALLARGARAAGNPRKSISDALRAELRRGVVIRTGRGEYVAADKMSAWHHQSPQASSPMRGAGPTHPRLRSTEPPGRIAS